MGDRAVDDELPAIPPTKGFARTLPSARAGQAFLVNAAGTVAKPTIGGMLKEMALLFIGLLLAMFLVTNLLTLIVTFTVAMWMGPVLVFGAFHMWARSVRGIARALQRLGTGDLVGAEREALLAANRRLMPRAYRGNAWMVAGSARWLRGDHREALVLVHRALAALPATGKYRALAVLTRLHEIQLLAITGEQALAGARLAALEHEGLPEGDLVRIQWIDTQLVLAFEAGDVSMLPDDLDAWSRSVLDTNRFGSTLVLLAWALQQRKQLDLVPVLLEVARDRLPECHIETAHPRLATWYRAMTANRAPSALAVSDPERLEA